MNLPGALGAGENDGGSQMLLCPAAFLTKTRFSFSASLLLAYKEAPLSRGNICHITEDSPETLVAKRERDRSHSKTDLFRACLFYGCPTQTLRLMGPVTPVQREGKG